MSFKMLIFYKNKSYCLERATKSDKKHLVQRLLTMFLTGDHECDSNY